MIRQTLLAALAAVMTLAGPPAAADPVKPTVLTNRRVRALAVDETLQVNASSANAASINIPPGTPPSSPSNGDCWITAAGLFCRINGATVGPYASTSQSGDFIASSAASPFALTLLDDSSAAAARATLGLGSLAMQNGTFSGTSSGTNTGDQDLSAYATNSALTAGLAGKQVAGDYLTTSSAAAAYQPLAGVLTATTASFTAAKDNKLAGIASGATANSSDATLLSRVNHTGTQTAATISDFAASVDARLTNYATTSALAAGYQPLASVLTATTASFTTAKDTKLSGIATGATANSSDAILLDRANHTGSQAESTITGLVADLAAKAPLASPAFTGTVSGVTKAMVGLGSADNTADAVKSVASAATLSTARTIGLSGKVTGTATSFNGSADVTIAVTGLTVDGAITPSSVASGGAITSSSATGGIGYATGAGGSVTQATSKATAVTCSKPTCAITLNAASLAATTIVGFTVTNTAIAANDQVICSHVSGGTSAAYTVNAFPAAGSYLLSVRNNTAAALAEAIVVRCSILKAVSA